MLMSIVSLLSLIALSPADALVQDPMYRAAGALGFAVVGEVEFAPRSHQPHRIQLTNLKAERKILCAGRGHYVVIAWSDREFPAREQRQYSSQSVSLARRRAEKLAGALGVRNSIVDLVNMAHRTPRPITVGRLASVDERRLDVKSALEIAGAAPSDDLGLGLFGEYGQKSKAVVWVDCLNHRKPLPRMARSLQLAHWGGNPSMTGHFCTYATQKNLQIKASASGPLASMLL